MTHSILLFFAVLSTLFFVFCLRITDPKEPTKEDAGYIFGSMIFTALFWALFYAFKN
jgi:hypothetical protein